MIYSKKPKIVLDELHINAGRKGVNKSIGFACGALLMKRDQFPAFA